MTDRPIIFSGPMVRALLDGRKTQTRRVLSPQPETFKLEDETECEVALFQAQDELVPRVRLGNVITMQKVNFAGGDRLWVRENWALHSRAIDVGTVVYGASVRHSGWNDAHEQIPVSQIPKGIPVRPLQEGWKPSIHMPRAFSRLTLIVTDVRVQRLQDISEGDALEEGMTWDTFKAGEAKGDDPVDAFRRLWDSLNGTRKDGRYAWAKNPWIVAVTFRVERGNIDALPKAA